MVAGAWDRRAGSGSPSPFYPAFLWAPMRKEAPRQTCLNGCVSSRVLSSKTSVDSRVVTRKRPLFDHWFGGENGLLGTGGVHRIGRDVSAAFNGAGGGRFDGRREQRHIGGA